jgi:hypothetical protein
MCALSILWCWVKVVPGCSDAPCITASCDGATPHVAGGTLAHLLPRVATYRSPAEQLRVRTPQLLFCLVVCVLALGAAVAQQPVTIYTYAGGASDTGDFVPATSAVIGGAAGLALMNDGSLIIADNGNTPDCPQSA